MIWLLLAILVAAICGAGFVWVLVAAVREDESNDSDWED